MAPYMKCDGCVSPVDCVADGMPEASLARGRPATLLLHNGVKGRGAHQTKKTNSAGPGRGGRTRSHEPSPDSWLRPHRGGSLAVGSRE